MNSESSDADNQRRSPTGPAEDSAAGAGGKIAKLMRKRGGSPETPEVSADKESWEFDDPETRPLGTIPHGAHQVNAGPPAENAENGDSAEAPNERRSFKAPLERKSGEAARRFTRVVTRPQTTMEAGTAAESMPSEQVISTGSESDNQFGKMRPSATSINYRPNRVIGVIDNIWQHSPLRWLEDHALWRVIVWAVMLLMAGGVGVLAWRFGNEAVRGISPSAVSSDPAVQAAEAAARIGKARDVVERFLQPGPWTGKLNMVLEPARTEPRMEHYYDVMKLKNPEVSSYTVEAPVVAAAEVWFTVNFRDSKGRDFQVLMKDGTDGLRLDWENFVAYGSMPWEEFCETRPSSSQSMRVRIRRSKAARAPYDDPAAFSAFEIEHQGGGAKRLTGYVPASSRVHQALADLVKDDQWHFMNLFLQFEGRGQAEDCVIVDIIKSNWLDQVSKAQ